MSYSIHQKGVSIYLSLIIMSILLALALGISAILVNQMKTIREMGDSVIAFYAADTGIEEVLMNRENPSSLCVEGSPPCYLGDARYYLSITPNCGGESGKFCIKSIGIYKKVRRAIEIKY